MAKKISTKVTVTDDLKKELKDFAHEIGVRAAVYAREELTTAAYEAFERFYCDYTPVPGGLYTSYKFKYYKPSGNPIYYDRTYNVLRNGIKKFYENKHGKIIRGGVQINPDWLEEVYDHNLSPKFVFDNIYELGLHGGSNKGIPPMVPTPEQYIQRKYDTLINSSIGLFIYDEIDAIKSSGKYSCFY